MVTTIQVSDELKKKLSKEKKDKTYEEFLREMLKDRERFIVAEQMREYGKKYAKQDLVELKEWEGTDVPWK